MHSERFFRYALSLTWVLIACLYGCSVKESPVRPETETQAGGEEAAPDPFLRGVVTVQFDEQTALQVEKALSEGEPAATRAPQLGGMGIKSMRRVFPDAGEYEERTRREGCTGSTTSSLTRKRRPPGPPPASASFPAW